MNQPVVVTSSNLVVTMVFVRRDASLSGIHNDLGQRYAFFSPQSLEDSVRNAMSSRAGFANQFVGNTVLDAYMGIVIRGRDHEVIGNRFERCRRAAVCLMEAKPDGDGFAAENTLVAGNDMIDCGGADFDPCADADCSSVLLFTDAPQRIGVNRVTGPGEPVLRATQPEGGFPHDRPP